MNIERLKAVADAKAQEALDAWGAETPDEEKAKALEAEATKYADRLERMKALLTIKEKAAAKEDPEPGGFKVVEDEADKKAKGKQWNFGEFLQAVSNDAREIQSYKSTEAWAEGGYSITDALGENFVGSMSAARDAKAISGLSEAVPADGGLLVGTDRNASIMARVYNVGDLLRRVDMTGISANSNGMTFFAESESSRKTGSRRGGIRFYWAAEGAEKTASHPTFRKLELKLNKAIGLVYATDELLADASALESWIMANLPEELRFGVEDSIIRGTNAGMPLGILNSPCLVSQAAEVGQAAATVVSENIIRMWSRRWAGARDYVWVVNQDVTPQLHQLNLGVGTGGQLVYMPPGGLSASPYGSIYARPVIESEYCSTLGTVGDIILAAFSEYQMIDKGGVQSASSIHVRFVYDESVFRFVLRVDGEPKWNLPLTPYQGTVTQSPFVVLATRA